MHPLLFWGFAFVMLVFGVSVIAQPNPVSSALSLVVSFIALAVLYISLDAFFIGIIQVLVYAGAVMVLFLFIIMLLDLRAGQRRKPQAATLVGSVAIALVFVAQLLQVLGQFSVGKQPMPALSGPVNDVRSVGLTLFTYYNLPFQIVAVLVLVATIGVVVLSKRELE
jgi:NADH-quinone oxidoreductase subunit J